MREVQLHEEEEQFAGLVAEAEAGESLTILRAGRPVAQIIPFPQQQADTRREEERQEAISRLKEIMHKGYDLGIVWNGRDELYNRD